ncbi:hypothetical protein NKR23_g8979 [Pleurostoma richardsiae]|uniref:Uncharacterized protein n=1 Tax=Pleurostoma richardsiae TaxID=41990 RepID=A0AA38RIH3_9PEZI|nr:hypothetical protein NKR23_g8979 [Pleurostoma richardsiae]
MAHGATISSPSAPTPEIQHSMPTMTGMRGDDRDRERSRISGDVLKSAIGFSPSPARSPGADTNCSFYLVGLPAGTCTRVLLSQIRDVGRVYETQIYPPSGGWDTSSAKLTFFERAAAERFYTRCMERGFTIGGCPVCVTWNMIPTAAPTGPKDLSRVLLIWGSSELVDIGTLTLYFSTRVRLQPDSWSAWEYGNASIVACCFGSYRREAETAKSVLERDFPDAVYVCYGEDPCMPADEETHDWMHHSCDDPDFAAINQLVRETCRAGAI